MAAKTTSERSSSLPPLLRPLSTEEVAAALSTAAAPPRKPRLLLNAAGAQDFNLRPPRAVPLQAENLFRRLAPDGSRHKGTVGCAAAARSGDRESVCTTPRGDGSAAPPLVQAVPVSLTSRAQPPQSTPPRRRTSHFKAVKAAYLGIPAPSDAGPVDPQGQSPIEEKSRSIAAVLEDQRDNEAIREARLRREQGDMRTGEDAIKFFTRHGGDPAAALKLVYCSRPPRGDWGGAPGPYDLVVVAAQDCQPEHFTISAGGVVHFRPGELSECMPLAEWMQQVLMYRVLSSMSLFRLYPHRKALAHWRSGARRTVFDRGRTRLARSWLFANPVFVEPLLQARRIIGEAAHLQVVRVPDKCCQLLEFVDLQRLRTTTLSGLQWDLERKSEEVIAIMNTLMDTIVQAASEESHEVRDRASKQVARCKAIVVEKQLARERSRRARILKEDEASVGVCVRTVAYMFQAALLDMFREAALKMRSRVEGTGLETPKKFFSIAMSLEDGFVKFSPARCEFEVAFQNLWQNLLDAVDAVPPLLSHRLLSRRVAFPHAALEASVAKPGAISGLLAQDEAWLAHTRAAWRAADANLTEAAKWAWNELNEPLSKAHAFVKSWDEEAFTAAARDFHEVRRDIARIKGLEEDVSRCRFQRVIGILFLDGRPLRELLVTAPERAASVMRQVLAALARNFCEAALRRAESAIRALADVPVELSGVAAFQVTYDRVCEEQRALEEVVQEIEAMYETLDELHIRISFDDQLFREAFKSKLEELTHKGIFEASLFISEKRRREIVENVIPAHMHTSIEDAGEPMSVSLLTSDAVLQP